MSIQQKKTGRFTVQVWNKATKKYVYIGSTMDKAEAERMDAQAREQFKIEFLKTSFARPETPKLDPFRLIDNDTFDDNLTELINMKNNLHGTFFMSPRYTLYEEEESCGAEMIELPVSGKVVA